MKFTQEGSVSLHVRKRAAHELELQVHDTGVGMTSAEMGKMFEPFSQAEEGKSGGGTGLGLAISRRIIEALNGTITGQSEFGRGSLFTIVIPFVEAKEEDVVRSEANTLTDLAACRLVPGQDVTIPVADDRDENRDVLVELLERAGFGTAQACNGQQTIELLRQGRMPLVLMDIRMPVMDGIEATKAIREDPTLRDTVAIAVTASVFPQFQEQLFEQRFDDLIGKPFGVAGVFAKIEKHLGVVFVEPAAPDDEALPRTEVASLTRELESEHGAASRERSIRELARAFDFESLKRVADELEVSAAMGD